MPDDDVSSDEYPQLAKSPVTLAICGACIGVFLATLAHCGIASTPDWIQTLWSLESCPDSLVTLGGLSLGHVWADAQWWRIGTAGFAHGSLLHLGLNVWSLVAVGPWVEQAWGAKRTAIMFLVGSVGGCLASAAWVEAPMIVGASSGLLALASALWLGRTYGSELLRDKLAPVSSRGLGLMLAALVALGFVVPVVAQAGHIGGLVVGLGFGTAWLGKSGAMRRGGWALLGGWLVLVSLGASSPQWRPGYHQYLGPFLLDRSEMEAALGHMRLAHAAHPEDPELANELAYTLAQSKLELAWAEELVRGALVVAPDDANYLDTLGWVYCQQGLPEQGRPWLLRASAASEGQQAEIEAHLVECGG